MSNIAKYIKSSKQKKPFSVNGALVQVDYENSNKLNYKSVINRIYEMIPSHLTRGIQKYVIGPNENLSDRHLQGMYKNNTIYISGDQPSEEEVLDDIVHEVSHHVEESHHNLVYSDNTIKKEFIRKRLELKNALILRKIDTKNFNFSNEEYDFNFDKFLYQEVGYNILGVVGANIFHSPYAATSLREYFASGFEAFYMKEDVQQLKKISPNLFKKIILLNDVDKIRRINNENF